MEQDRQRLHDLKQPLNVIGLAAANMAHRLSREDCVSDQSYYQSKLDVVKTQVEKLSAMLDEMLEQYGNSGCE